MTKPMNSGRREDLFDEIDAICDHVKALIFAENQIRKRLVVSLARLDHLRAAIAAVEAVCQHEVSAED